MKSRCMGDCAAADDNPMKLMSIAMKPLCAPPFPLDYIEEMTALMGRRWKDAISRSQKRKGRCAGEVLCSTDGKLEETVPEKV